MEDGLGEISLCCPGAQGGCGCGFSLDGVPLVVPAVGDEDVGSRQFVQLGGVGEVAGHDDLGGGVLAGGGMWDHVVGCPLVVGGFSLRIQYEWGKSGLGAAGFFWSFACGGTLDSTRYGGLDVSGAATWVAAAVAACKRAMVSGSGGGGLVRG